MSRRAEGGTATAPKPLRGAARLPAIPCCCPTSGGIGCPFSLGESKYEQAAPLLFHLLCGFTGYLSCFVIHPVCVAGGGSWIFDARGWVCSGADVCRASGSSGAPLLRS